MKSSIDGAISLAHWAQRVRRSELQTLLSDASAPGVLSLALGLPDPQLFPMDALAQASSKVFAEGTQSLQYSPHFARLKRQVADLMQRRGVACDESGIFLTSGAQQGLSLMARLLLNRADTVLVEEYTYTGLLQAILPSEARILTVPTDPNTGIDVEAVEDHLRSGARPAFLYTIPEGHNPTGASMSLDKRKRLLEIAQTWRLPIIEDDAYGFLQYDEEVRAPLRSTDSSWVIYVGSFSKILAPSLRVGWLVVPQRLTAALSVLKESTDIDTTTFSQRIVSACLEGSDLTGHISILRNIYREKRDRMLAALQRRSTPSLTWSTPRSGMFLWVRAGDGVDTSEALQLALRDERVAFVPGAAFSPHGNGGDNWLRLNFSRPGFEMIDEGIDRITRVISRCMS